MSPTIKYDIASIFDLFYIEQHDPLADSIKLSRKESALELFSAHENPDSEEIEDPIAFLRFQYFRDEIPFLNMVYVDESRRGHGIGKELVTAWEDKMREWGHEIVMTSTLANETAQHFYRKCGYQDAGGFVLPGEPLEIILTKRL